MRARDRESQARPVSDLGLFRWCYDEVDTPMSCMSVLPIVYGTMPSCFASVLVGFLL